MLIVNAAKSKTVDFAKTLQRMAAVTSARGAQSGGLVTLCQDGSAYRCRFIPSKREDLASSLLFWFKIGLFLHSLWAKLCNLLCCCFRRYGNAVGTRARLSKECSLFLGHTRFATSSAPTVIESHPHRFGNARTVFMWRCDGSGRWASSLERMEVYITHNGDLDFFELYGRLRTHSDLSLWLRQVLQINNKTAQCDSTKIAGLMELFRTQGLWYASLRLAFQNVVQPSFDSVIRGENLPSTAHMSQAAKLADKLFEDFTKNSALDTQAHFDELARRLANSLVQNVGTLKDFVAPCGDCMQVAQEALRCFLANDLFLSLKHFLSKAHGSFGLSVCCSLDPNAVALASRGQPMSVAFSALEGVVLWGSEASALMVPYGKSEGDGEEHPVPLTCHSQDFEAGWAGTVRAEDSARCVYRHDLDEGLGEVVELLVLSDEKERARALRAGAVCCEGTRFQPFELEELCLRVYKAGADTFLTHEAFTEGASLVDLLHNPHVDPLPKQVPGPQRVAEDIRCIPKILTTIRQHWEDPASRVNGTAEALFNQLAQKVDAVEANDCGRLEIDVLVMAVEASLWIGEQFASDLQNLFPKLRVVPLSANKIVGVFSNFQGADAMTGFSFCSTTMSLKNTIVIAISHSGQTFPTLHATHTLRQICGDRIFVVTGCIDCKMSSAVGQGAHAGAEWVNRVLPTYAGWRPSEALTVSTVACHHTLTELLLSFARRADASPPAFKAHAGLLLSQSDIGDIERLNRSFIVNTASDTVGACRDGRKRPTAISKDLERQGRQWALHILEGPHSWILSALYIFGTVITAHPLFLSIKVAIWGEKKEAEEGTDNLHFIALALDALLYCFLPLVFSLLLRLLSRRELFARLGKRTLVIGDVPYVHQLLESYVSKLFSLSYSIASIEVHGANPIDHLVHRFTHRVCRGVLLAVGRPDGRLFSQTKAESWILMALQQAKAIVHLGTPPEVLTVGHNPYSKPSVVDRSCCLSQRRPRFICEALPDIDSTENEPMKRMSTFKHVGKQSASASVRELEPTWMVADTTEGEEDTGPPLGAYLLDASDDATKENFQLIQHIATAQTDVSFHGIRSPELSLHTKSMKQGTRDASQHLPSPSHHSLSHHRPEISVHRSVGDLSMHRSVGGGESSQHARHEQHGGVGHIELARALSGLRGDPFSDISAHSLRRRGAPPGGSILSVSIETAAGVRQSSFRHGTSAVKEGKEGRQEGEEGGGSTLDEVLNHCTALETWYENRYASLERYLSFLVLFHAMAHRVASFLPLSFDTSRSQSQLRIATTAAPISAAEIQHEWAMPSPARQAKFLDTLEEQEGAAPDQASPRPSPLHALGVETAPVVPQQSAEAMGTSGETSEHAQPYTTPRETSHPPAPARMPGAGTELGA